MKKIKTQMQLSSYFKVFALVVTLVAWTSVVSQLKLTAPDGVELTANLSSNGQPKLKKTQGSGEFDNVHACIQDKAGNLWFGCTGEGVYKYDGKLFYQYTKANGLSSNTVWCLLEDKAGSIWIGTNSGLNVFNGKSFVSVHIPLRSGSKLTPFSTLGTGSNSKINVWSIIQDKSEQLWFATTEGVFCYKNGSFSRFLESGNLKVGDFKANKVEYILEDMDGSFWFGGRGNKGVFRYDGKSLSNFRTKGEEWSWPSLLDKSGKIWFSNWGALYSCVSDGQNGKTQNSGNSAIERKNFVFTKLEGTCTVNTTRIIQDKEGDIWYGGDIDKGGLCCYNGVRSKQFTKKDGLINCSIWTIFEDRLGYIWVGTRNTGLFRFDGKTFENFSD